jgi:DNA-binding HxlR family transcriptional regulator
LLLASVIFIIKSRRFRKARKHLSFDLVKPYDQYCPVAHALDLVGERWALLLVRELQHGPLRYSDLHERLPRCSTNVLATRLKELEAGGVITRRKLPPPAASTVYELTETGASLAPVIGALARWGLQTLGPPPPDIDNPPGWLEKALRTTVAAHVPAARIGFEVGEERATVAAGTVVPGIAEDADAVVSGTPVMLYELLVCGDTRAAEISGDAEVVAELIRALAPTQPVATPASAG